MRVGVLISIVLATSDWALFSPNKPVVSTSTATVGDEMISDLFNFMPPASKSPAIPLVSRPSTLPPASGSSTTPLTPKPSTVLAPELPAPSLTPNPSTLPPALELYTPSNQSEGTPRPGTMQLAVAPDTLMCDALDAIPIQPVQMSHQLGATPDQPHTGCSHTSNVAPGLDLHQPPIFTPFALPKEDTVHGTPILSFVYPHPIDGPQQIVPDCAHPPASERSPSLPCSHGTACKTSSNPPPDPLVNVMNEPVWMKKKQTLDYFRGTFKLGSLPNVIEHWYELEEQLGFQNAVSVRE